MPFDAMSDSTLPSESGAELRRVLEDRSLAEGKSDGNSVSDILHAVRTHLKMEVAFVSEFTHGRRIFRYVDSSWPKNPVRVGEGGPLEESYCQRIVEGRMPELLADARTNSVAAELPETFSLPIGAHLSVPIRLSDGSVYGTFCCFSRHADLSLNYRDLNVMRVFAELAGKMIDRERLSKQRLSLSRDRIEHVLHSDAMHIVYQPIFDLSQARIAGLESLSRFVMTPTRSPDIWFQEAHKVGLGVDLEMRAIEQALQVLPQLNPSIDLAVNASPEVILDPRFEALLAKQTSLEHLVLEITEHAAVEHYEEIADKLKTYRELGLQLAVDDAGAGYASFRHILNLEPDRIKLDMSLTRDIDSDPVRRALTVALIHFSSETGSTLVAEGVETEAEAATLIELGIEKAQGYFLGRPMTFDELQKTGCLNNSNPIKPGVASFSSLNGR